MGRKSLRDAATFASILGMLSAGRHGPDVRSRKPAQARVSAARRQLFSPAEGMVSHDHNGKAYTRLRSGAIVRVPAQDHRGAFVRALRGARDRVATVRERRG